MFVEMVVPTPNELRQERHVAPLGLQEYLGVIFLLLQT